MAILLDQFVRQLVDSSLMSAGEVTALIAAVPADKKPRDGEQLAKELVRQNGLDRNVVKCQQLAWGEVGVQ